MAMGRVLTPHPLELGVQKRTHLVVTMHFHRGANPCYVSRKAILVSLECRVGRDCELVVDACAGVLDVKTFDLGELGRTHEAFAWDAGGSAAVSVRCCFSRCCLNSPAYTGS